MCRHIQRISTNMKPIKFFTISASKRKLSMKVTQQHEHLTIKKNRKVKSVESIQHRDRTAVSFMRCRAVVFSSVSLLSVFQTEADMLKRLSLIRAFTSPQRYITGMNGGKNV